MKKSMLSADPEREVRKVSCPAVEYMEIRAYLIKHGAEVTYIDTFPDEDFPDEAFITTFLVARPPRPLK